MVRFPPDRELIGQRMPRLCQTSFFRWKFGHHIRSKSEVAQVNEALCKVLAHNICVLNQKQHELGIETVFWKEPAGQQAIAV
jgi:hypothetical protein